MKKTYTEEQKNEVLARLFAGELIASISEDTGIAKSTLYAWIKSNGKKKNKALSLKHCNLGSRPPFCGQAQALSDGSQALCSICGSLWSGRSGRQAPLPDKSRSVCDRLRPQSSDRCLR